MELNFNTSSINFRFDSFGFLSNIHCTYIFIPFFLFALFLRLEKKNGTSISDQIVSRLIFFLMQHCQHR